MSTVQLETIWNIATRPVHMCRNLPEALVGLISDEAFSTFCDRLDCWLEILYKEHKREHRQFMCFFVTMGLLCFFQVSLVLASSPSPGIWMSPVLLVSPILFFLVWWYSCRRPYGALSIDEIIYKFHGECADMTRQAPNLYFSVGSACRGYVGRIAVSLTLSSDVTCHLRFRPICAGTCRLPSKGW
jgi:hypothetical protein